MIATVLSCSASLFAELYDYRGIDGASPTVSFLLRVAFFVVVVAAVVSALCRK